MTKLLFSAAALAGVAAAAALPAPSFAQQTQGGLAEIVVFGTDPCPRATDDQIVVCRRLPESMRYRMPEAYRQSGPPQPGQSWAHKSEVLETVGDTGTFSCSPVGPGGYTGCLTQVIRQSREGRRQQAEELVPPQN